MKVLARLSALLLMLLLVTQAGWAVPECGREDAGPVPAHHHGMPTGHQDQTPAPSTHHDGCAVAVCATMTSCAPVVALHATGLRPTPRPDGSARIHGLLATSSPVGPVAPEPPPPRV